MTGHGSKYGRQKEAAIAALLTQRNVEEAAASIHISTRTLLRWMQQPDFDAAYRAARRAAFGQAVARLHHGSSAAASTILKIMVDSNAPVSVRLRAADIVMERTGKAMELEDLEARLEALERAAADSEKGPRR